MYFPVTFTARDCGTSSSLSSTFNWWYVYVPEKVKEKEMKVDLLDFTDVMKKVFSTCEINGFPKYRLFVDEKEQKAIVEFALAGYPKEKLSVSVKPYENSKDQKMLWVSGEEVEPNMTEGYEMVSGTMKSSRFKFGVLLPKYMEVVSSKYENGVLQIHLKQNVPEEEKEMKIAIL